jgi:outer membrane protein assembly factor BamA
MLFRARQCAPFLFLLLTASPAAADEPAPKPPLAETGPVDVRLTAADPTDLPRPLPLDPEAVAPPSGADSAEVEKKGRELVIAPIPIVNPTFGTGLALVAGLVFPIDKNDKDSPPTVAGVGGFYTDNHSYAVAAAIRTYLDHDRWRLLGIAATSQLNYDFFGVGSGAGSAGKSIPLSQRVDAFGLEGLRRVASSLFAGIRYVYARSVIRVDGENPDVSFPERDLEEVSASLGLHVQGDSRDSTFNPSRGVLADLRTDFYDPAFGSTRTYQSYSASGNLYLAAGARQILAVRLSACAAHGDVPTYALCLFGSHNDLRGYDIGRYRDRAMFATQAEYRLSLPESLGFFGKFGFVAFAGVGEVAPSFSNLNSDELLPGGGAGIRFLVARQNRINFRIDYAWGKAGSRGLYIGVGEAF